MKRFFFYSQLYGAYLANTVKSRMAYRADFWVGFTANLMIQLIGVLFITSLTARIPQIRGWGRHEILFIFGIAQAVFGLFNVLFTNLFELSGRYILEGGFDRVLLRPLGSYFQVVTERIDLEDLPGVLLGLLMAGYAAGKLHLDPTPGRVALVALALANGCAIYAAVFTALAGLTFWFRDRGSIASVVLMLEGFARYPATIFGKWLQSVLTWVVPFAFAAFYPSAWLLRKPGSGTMVVLAPLAALAAALVAAAVWRRGVRRYESAGS
ncbi:MAG: ABC-2 family transporter protein [Candidatus Edwardsbacteria bacterium]|jgi:ABC-2 type transport system permease protein|nr:ABC-2 family transporter protein [Candidatus Edwardsbacteria bacterium]